MDCNMLISAWKTRELQRTKFTKSEEIDLGVKTVLNLKIEPAKQDEQLNQENNSTSFDV